MAKRKNKNYRTEVYFVGGKMKRRRIPLIEQRSDRLCGAQHVEWLSGLLFQAIDGVTTPLYEAAVRNGGDYDGWECVIVT